MTPQGPGRHCAACQKTVVDFTQKTDAEILAALTRAAGGTCGRFRAEQLARPLLPLVAQGPSRWRVWLAAAVAVWGLREGAGAPAKAQVTTELRPLGAPATQFDSNQLQKKVLVEGKITDGSTHEGLPGATVSLKGTNIWCSTKADGTFQLTVPEEYAESASLAVIVSFVGYETQQVAVTAKTGVPVVEVALALNVTFLGGPELILPLSNPWPWHPRRFYNWLARPFRRG
ncbi:carboxypeptidase-like regulatory domain-containing protein [Hymenobacter caeli]|uniref:Carboxypeptidase-like regulatory domain-containing protein n=1 Tax=Hymenobacter caeli TaxID=2735894 RepID=A0ABX2FQC2_9BACT|nr:carboxypeptidase-like regulatory domain-containing protein [Hymenobacter caeli]NRT19304.1 hypothetical protein [Hymenobacter caeli]